MNLKNEVKAFLLTCLIPIGLVAFGYLIYLYPRFCLLTTLFVLFTAMFTTTLYRIYQSILTDLEEDAERKENNSCCK